MMGLLMNDFNATPVSSLMGPARGLMLKRNVDRLAGVLAKGDLNLLPLRFFNVLAERLLAVD